MKCLKCGQESIIYHIGNKQVVAVDCLNFNMLTDEQRQELIQQYTTGVFIGEFGVSGSIIESHEDMVDGQKIKVIDEFKLDSISFIGI